MNCVLLVLTPKAMPLPAEPASREVIVRLAPLAWAHTSVEPALINSAKQVAMLSAVSPIRFQCCSAVPSNSISVFPPAPNSGCPAKVIVADAYRLPGQTSS